MPKKQLTIKNKMVWAHIQEQWRDLNEKGKSKIEVNHYNVFNGYQIFKVTPNSITKD